jgi:hypothetical protein
MAERDQIPIKKRFQWNDPYFKQGGQDQKPNQPFIVDLVTLETLFLQNIPGEVAVGGDQRWAAVESPGRNIPLYQYTGGEDSIEFTIQWYANDINKDDVIRKCKWLRSLSKNDSYDKPPHHIKFAFGGLFRSSKWIVYSANYRLTNFDRPAGMMPCLAVQEVVLKRVDERNPSRSNYLQIDT